AAAGCGLATVSVTAVSMRRMIVLQTDIVVPFLEDRAQAVEARQATARPIAGLAPRARRAAG
ncbi:MAG TPA: hypothetical protein VI363_09045, partial [Burkholderiales bacterium]